MIRLMPDEYGDLILPPMPWCNVVANEHVGFIVSEKGSASTWASNSREHRLSTWHNDPVMDPTSEAIYIRDEGTAGTAKSYWSALPGPVPHPGPYRVRHGFGYSVFEHIVHDIAHEVTMFVPKDDPCRVTRVRLTNKGPLERELSAFTFHEWVLGESKTKRSASVISEWNDPSEAIVARLKEPDSFGPGIAFSHLRLVDGENTVNHWTDAAQFLGGNDETAPQAVVSQDFDADHDESSDPCAAMQVRLRLKPGESVEFVWTMGEVATVSQVGELCSKYDSSEQISLELEKVRDFWRDLVGRVQIATPSPELNLMVNGWLVYQNLSCRLLARSSYYQGGGGFGFRDQLQDASAFMLQRPELTRNQILLHAAHQFVEGDVLHWWHPPNDLGIRTRFADDLLWLPLVTAEYVQATGDRSIWDQTVPFLRSQLLDDDQVEMLVTAEASGESDSVYEHCCRAIDRSLQTGIHGLPLMGSGDWNDGMNRIGCLGVGESVWMGFFLYRILDLMLPVLAARGDAERFDRYQDARGSLRQSLNAEGWDGEWFIRAFHDGGTVIGSATSHECQINALVQAWAVISGATDLERQRQAIDMATARLVDAEAGLIRLLNPPFHDSPVDPGYIKGYLPGIRENGGQYTHGILWFVRTVAQLGEGDRAAKLLQMISPVRHGSTADRMATYQTEPYVVAADVYSVSPHAGRGGWSWYTGSAGWMFRVAIEDILGIRAKEGEILAIDPRIQRDWKELAVRLVWPVDESTYHITIRNPDGRQAARPLRYVRRSGRTGRAGGSPPATRWRRKRASHRSHNVR